MLTRSYDEILADALAHCLLYCPEWTNFNRSDPGVTMLQNLSAFTNLQQSYIGEVTDELSLRLLGLLGYEPACIHPASLLAAPVHRTARLLPAHTKLLVGSLCFETQAPVPLYPWSLAAAYTCSGGSYRDVTFLLDHSAALSVAVFGATPKAGDSFCCVLQGEIDESMPFLFYAGIADEKRRNAFLEGDDLVFAKTEWQYYTAQGWVRAEAEDETRCFLNSGAIRLRLNAGAPAVFDGAPAKGFAVRCVVLSAEYDLAPQICTFRENLFALCQQNTAAASFVFSGGEPVRVFSGMTAFENLFVYCREDDGGPYRAYFPFAGQPEGGRCFLRRDEPDGAVTLVFDRERFGLAPCKSADAVRVVCYDSNMLHHRLLGTAYGYENQLLEIDLLENVLPQGFCLLAEQRQTGQDPAYLFINPNDERPDSLCYEVLSARGAVNVRQNGLAGECRLYLCDCAVTAGAAGNLREGSLLAPLSDPDAAEDTTPPPACQSHSPGRGGISCETPELLRRRFAADMARATSAVLLTDYEELVRQTPGLCIHKVRAIADCENNLVKIAVKPISENRFSRLSPVYLRQIRRYLEPRRMITTQIELLQPRYVAIDVSLTVSVKNYYENMRGEIERLFESELDFIATDHSFGEVVRFAALYQKLEALQGLESIYSLSLSPRSHEGASMDGADIQLGENSLCYLGRLDLELSTAFYSNLTND